MVWGVDVYMRCSDPECKVDQLRHDAKFCSECGKPAEQHRPPPYAETRPTRGVYEITIKIRREFDSKDEADEAAYKSTIYEDMRVGDCQGVDGASPYSVSFVKSTVTPETHPFECGYCKNESTHDYEREHPIVAESEAFRCAACEQQQWVRREAEHADS